MPRFRAGISRRRRISEVVSYQLTNTDDPRNGGFARHYTTRQG